MATNTETFQNRIINLKKATADAGEALYDKDKLTDGRQAFPPLFNGQRPEPCPANDSHGGVRAVLVSR